MIGGASTEELPSGIVSFVFTDIEQSTRLLRKLGDDYGEILDRHFAVMREAWLAHGGHEIDHAGDSTFVVFQDAGEAVLACAEAQRLLGREPWPRGDQIRVRMGVHTGLGMPRGHGYVALAVHQAARVMSVGHGGQVLVSGDTAERLTHLDGVELVPIGRYRLRDFEGPAPLCQLAGPELASTFPAVRALPADGHNLVAPPTPFVGRDVERREVASTIGARRLVTLVGPGGVGKSRLAVEVGLDVASAWRDGVWLVDLSALQDPSELATAIGAAVGAPRQGGDRWDDVIDHLRKQAALVILDCCEVFPDACAKAATSLLAACSECGVLATSRVPLAAPAEVVHKIDPLPVPAAVESIVDVANSPAVELFLDRAHAAGHEIKLDERSAATVIAICSRLDGLPLALELAAARLGALSLQQVLDGLDDRFRLLRSRSASVPARQRTMEGLLEWSDRLLDDAERACLRRLSLFGSSFTLDAAAACAGDDGVDPLDVAELVYSLVDKSLVVADLTADGSRYRLLDSVRDYARRQLADHDDVDRPAVRLASWYLDWIGPEHRAKSDWTSYTGSEVSNLRALVSVVATPRPDLAQQLALTIGDYLDAVNSFRDGVEEVGRYVADLTEPSPILVSLHACLAGLHLRTGDIAAAEAALAAAEHVRDHVGGVPPWDDVAIERTQGQLLIRKGDYAAAAELARSTLATDVSIRGRGRMYSQLGIAAVASGDLATAWDACRQELAAYEELGDQMYQASAHGNLAEIALRRGDVAAAAHHQKACLALGLELDARALVGFSLIVAARLSASAGRYDVAVTLHARADTILDTIGLALYADDRRLSDEMLAEARRTIGDTAYESASAEGIALELPEAASMADRVLAAVAEGQR